MSFYDEMEVSVAEVVDYAKLDGSFAKALQEVVKKKVAVEEAKRRGLSVSDEELQKACDTFRIINNLTTSAATEEWLKGNGITLDTLENFLESNLLIYELKNQLLNECDKKKYIASDKVQDLIREMAFEEWLAKSVGQE
jgi:hypothetical protein